MTPALLILPLLAVAAGIVFAASGMEQRSRFTALGKEPAPYQPPPWRPFWRADVRKQIAKLRAQQARRERVVVMGMPGWAG